MSDESGKSRSAPSSEVDGRQVIGYMLVDPNTFAPEYDGIIHDTLDAALRELAASPDNIIEHDRPCCLAEACVPWTIATVTVDPVVQQKALAAMQAAWDDENACWLRMAEEGRAHGFP